MRTKSAKRKAKRKALARDGLISSLFAFRFSLSLPHSL